MDPFFLVVIIEPTLQLAMGMDPKVLFNQSFETALKGRVLDELNRVARSSQNARVKSGFSLKFNLMSDDIAKMACRDLTGPPVVTIPPNVFRAHLWPIQKDYSDMEALQSKIAPGPWKKGVVRKQIEGENGVGGRIPETGRNFAFVSLGWLERAVSGPPPLRRYHRIDRRELVFGWAQWSFTNSAMPWGYPSTVRAL